MLEHFADLAGLEVSQLLPPKLGSLVPARAVTRVEPQEILKESAARAGVSRAQA